ncbi:MAG: hypothetical protein QME60_02875 [Verrucomicrobiota bacterium]|nr:hypothetical protein [Verrucomicrobiota bacterium]
MIRNPIHRVLSTIRRRQVRCLLLGGQACIVYGAAEFSRDTDLAVMPDQETFDRFNAALRDLKAECVAVPPFRRKFLERGHAIHFRCAGEDVQGMRIDILSHMRGVDPFPALWARRHSLTLDDGESIDVMALPDLVQAKKTQRDKDWPMLRRLLEADYFAYGQNPRRESALFWLRELRTVSLLREVAQRYPAELRETIARRPLLSSLDQPDNSLIEKALEQEATAEREADRLYWLPLKKELEQLRHSQGR